jgi:hypothetical protein
MAVTAEGCGEIGAEPVTASFAEWIDALHGETGQVLHLYSLSSRKAQIDSVATVCRWQLKKLGAPLGGLTTRGKIPGQAT